VIRKIGNILPKLSSITRVVPISCKGMGTVRLRGLNVMCLVLNIFLLRERAHFVAR